MLPLKRIICPIDYSEPSYEALHRASELAQFFGAELGVLHVMPTIAQEVAARVYDTPEHNHVRTDSARKKLCGIIAERIPGDVRAHPVIRIGDAADEIERAAGEEHADLIVIATHGLTGWRHLVFGSVTEKVLRLSHCPLLVIHPPRQ
jgi:nucleotide-binding universal stress UspA family protein